MYPALPEIAEYFTIWTVKVAQKLWYFVGKKYQTKATWKWKIKNTDMNSIVWMPFSIHTVSFIDSFTT